MSPESFIANIENPPRVPTPKTAGAISVEVTTGLAGLPSAGATHMALVIVTFDGVVDPVVVDVAPINATEPILSSTMLCGIVKVETET